MARREPDLLDIPQPRTALPAEQHTLGSAIISKTAVAKMLDLLSAAEFYLTAHQHIYRAVAFLAARSEPVDVFSVADELQKAGTLESVGGQAYINELAGGVPTAAHVEHYARQVKNASDLRRLLAAGQEIAIQAQEQPDAEVVLLASETILAEARRSLERGGRRTGPEVLTGPELDARVFPPRAWLLPNLLPVPSVALLAGWPKAKKTFFAADLGAALACGGRALGQIPVAEHGVLLCLTEDPFEDSKARLERHFEHGHWPEHLHVTEECPRLDEGGEAWLHAFLPKHPEVRYVVLDPLVNVRGAGRNSSGNVYGADYGDMNAFHQIARPHGVCLLLLHHVNKIPNADPFACISGSNAIYGAVDVAMVLVTNADASTGVLHAKGRKGVRPLKWSLTWDERLGWTYQGDAGAEEDCAPEYRPLLEILREAGEPIPHRELIRGLLASGCGESAAKMRIKRARDLGLIAGEAGLYWLSARRTGVTASPGDYGDQGNPGDCGDSVTGNDAPLPPEDTAPSVTPVTPVTLVTLVTPVTEPSANGADFRTSLRLVALGQAFPRLELPGLLVHAGEPAWAAFCRDGDTEELYTAFAALARDEEPPPEE